MNTIHLYLRRGPARGLSVLSHTFPPGKAMASATQIVPGDKKAAWLQAAISNAEVKAIYSCRASGISKPAVCPVPWVDLPAGHPCEAL